MNHISNYKPQIKKSNITNERQLILQDFLNKLNPERIKSGYKPLSPKALAVKLGHLSTSDLKWFYYDCDNKSNFGAHFWTSLRDK